MTCADDSDAAARTAMFSTTNPLLLQVRNIAKRFGSIPAIGAARFSLFAGEVLGLIGPNGSGKTTLLDCLCGLQPADSHEVLCGSQRMRPRQLRDVLFYVPEAATPYPEDTVQQVLRFFGAAFRLPKDRLDQVVGDLGLEAVMVSRSGQLSKGWRRRLLLAIGLLSPQPALVMDEPFDGLDLRQTREVMRVLRAAAARGRALLLSIHTLSDAERVCDRLVLLSASRVVGEGSLGELRVQSGNPNATLEDIFLART
jgi:ABC-2 type transport system ATP-binding protein